MSSTSKKSQDDSPQVVTDGNVEQQFLWLTNTAGNELAALVGGISSTSQLDERAVEYLRSIEQVAGALAEKYGQDAIPAPDPQDLPGAYGRVAPLAEDQRLEESKVDAAEVKAKQTEGAPTVGEEGALEYPEDKGSKSSK